MQLSMSIKDIYYGRLLFDKEGDIWEVKEIGEHPVIEGILQIKLKHWKREITRDISFYNLAHEYYLKHPLEKMDVTPKKRYWLWDTRSDIDEDLIYKGYFYMDDEGIRTNGVDYVNKKYLVRKHENEFIDV